MLREGTLTQSSTKRVRGFSLIELMVTMGIGLVLAATAVPVVTSAMRSYRLRSSVNAVAGVIQSTRYRAIYQGYPFRVSFDRASSTYQVLSKPAAAGSFANLGGAVPFSSGDYQISQDTVLQFSPGGSVSVITGSANFTVGQGSNYKSLAVSTYGSVSVQ
jgi:prepilin-type N-terminal cleavage/methylation domain-containing protein